MLNVDIFMRVYIKLKMIEFNNAELDILIFCLQKFLISCHSYNYPNSFYFEIDKLKNKIILIKEFENNVEHF